jgi:hypothetical protein
MLATAARLAEELGTEERSKRVGRSRAHPRGCWSSDFTPVAMRRSNLDALRAMTARRQTFQAPTSAPPTPHARARQAASRQTSAREPPPPRDAPLHPETPDSPDRVLRRRTRRQTALQPIRRARTSAGASGSAARHAVCRKPLRHEAGCAPDTKLSCSRRPPRHRALATGRGGGAALPLKTSEEIIVGQVLP